MVLTWALAGLTSTPASAQWLATLSVTGGKDGAEVTRITTSVSSAKGEIEFGAVNALPSSRQRKFSPWAQFAREHVVDQGKFFVATLVAKVTLSNGPRCFRPGMPDCVPLGQTVQLFIHQTPVSFPAARLRYATGTSTVWDRQGSGSQVPEVPSLLRSGLNDGDQVVHQVALYVSHTDLAGEKSIPLQYSVRARK
jgi:hypothetical protein